MPPPPSTNCLRLRDYIGQRMRMSHIDQPLMLMELLGRRSPAPAQDVARRILGEDVTQFATPPNWSTHGGQGSPSTASPPTARVPTA